MSNYNTGNPVPSIDPRDLDDNATVFDQLMNSTANSVADRKGVQRKTWYKVELDVNTVMSPNVVALGGLTGAANKGFYFTGSGAMATYDLAPQGRTFLAATTQAAQRSALALGTASTADVTTSNIDITSGRVLRTGDYGLGAPIFLTTQDLNTLTVGNQYYVTAGVTNGPPGATNGWVSVLPVNVNFCAQMFIEEVTGLRWTRTKNFGTWTAWDTPAKRGTNADITSMTALTSVTSSLVVGAPFGLQSYTLATLPSASTFGGRLINVSDATGGPKTCRSNGTVWQILNTTTTVS